MTCSMRRDNLESKHDKYHKGRLVVTKILGARCWRPPFVPRRIPVGRFAVFRVRGDRFAWSNGDAGGGRYLADACATVTSGSVGKGGARGARSPAD
jgi:hypothetical protein